MSILCNERDAAMDVAWRSAIEPTLIALCFVFLYFHEYFRGVPWQATTLVFAAITLVAYTAYLFVVATPV